jgi:ferredoxin
VSTRLEISVDRDVCMGSGSCGFHAPETFDLDDECKVVVLDGRDPDERIIAAADACPTRAISLSRAARDE